MSNSIKVFIISFFLIVISLASVFSTYKRHKSYQMQVFINSDVIRKNFESRNFDFINQIDVNYPSLNIFAMPMKSLKAEYLFAKDSVMQAIKLHEEGAKDNPYLMYSEANLAGIYQRMGLYDQFEFYARKAHKNLPNNPLHFVHMTRLLSSEGKIDSVFYNFHNMDAEVKKRDEQIWIMTLSAIVNDTALNKCASSPTIIPNC